MAGIDWNQIIAGSAIGTAFTASVALAGHLLSRSTTIDTSKIEDRSKFTRDLMEQVEMLYQECGELRHAAVTAQRRELSFIRLMSQIGGEIRVLGQIVADLFLELMKEKPRKDELLEDCQNLTDCSQRMNLILEQEQRLSEALEALKEQKEDSKAKP